MGQKDWVQPLVDCGSSPAEAFDYLTPALAWMSRFPKEPFPPSLQSTPYETRGFRRENYWLTFLRSMGVPSSIIKSFLWKALPLLTFGAESQDITKELGKRNQTLSKINRLPLLKMPYC